ncbi:hypothetical protein Tco_0866094 [Tanacetum coccineum]
MGIVGLCVLATGKGYRGRQKTITEASLRRHLKLKDDGGITSLPNTEIFEQLALIGITSSPSLTTTTLVWAFQLSITPHSKTTPTTEEPAPMPYESPLQSVHSLGCDEGSVSLNELMDLVTQLTTKVGSLENELINTKKIYGSALTKLVNRVKKLEKQVKTGIVRRGTKIVLSKDEAVEEDSAKQGRSLIDELDMDANFSLVPSHDAEIQEKISDDTEVLLEEEETINDRYVPFSTSSATPEVSTATESMVYIRMSAKKKKDKGKAIMIEDESKEYDKVRKKEAVTEVDIAHVIDWDNPAIIRYHALQNRPRSVAEVRKNMMVYLKNQGGYKMKDFKGMSYDDIRPIFKKVWDQIHSFVPMDSEEEVQRLKRAVGFNGNHLVPDEGINVEALQTKYLIIRWEVHSNDTMQFWKIIRVGNNTEMYQVFEDMLKNFDRDDLVKLWSLVQERYNSSGLTKEKR